MTVQQFSEVNPYLFAHIDTIHGVSGYEKVFWKPFHIKALVDTNKLTTFGPRSFTSDKRNRVYVLQ